MLPQFAVLPCGSFFSAGERNGTGLPVTILNWHGLQLKIRVEVKEAFGIVSLWFGFWRKLKVREIGILVYLHESEMNSSFVSAL